MNKLQRGFIPLIPLLVIGGSFLITAGVVFVKTEGFSSFSKRARAGNDCPSKESQSDCESLRDTQNRVKCRWVDLSKDALGVTTEGETSVLGQNTTKEIVGTKKVVIPTNKTAAKNEEAKKQPIPTNTTAAKKDKKSGNCITISYTDAPASTVTPNPSKTPSPVRSSAQSTPTATKARATPTKTPFEQCRDAKGGGGRSAQSGSVCYMKDCASDCQYKYTHNDPCTRTSTGWDCTNACGNHSCKTPTATPKRSSGSTTNTAN